MDVDREIARALARIMAGVDARLAAVPARSREWANRSVGQWTGKRGRIWKKEK